MKKTINDPEELRLTHRQQILLRAGREFSSVLTEQQLRHMEVEKRVLGQVDPTTNEPCTDIYSVTDDGELTYMFAVHTVARHWYFHCYLHRTQAQYNRHLKKRTKRRLYGCVIPHISATQTEGLVADIHLIGEGLSEMTVVHEVIHAAGHWSRNLKILEAKKLSAPYSGRLIVREELQCRTVESATLQILNRVRGFGFRCIPLIETDLYCHAA